MSDSEHVSVVKNQDNDYLGPTRAGRMVIGYVEEVNGPEGAEVQEFVATRHELLVLVKHWERRALEIDFFWFWSAQTSSCEAREKAFARQRVNRVAELLGDAVVDEAVSEVWKDFGKEQEQRAWNIFMHGDKDQIRAFQDEVHAEMEKRDSTRGR